MTPPIATYRLQFNPNFGFDAAREIVDYLHNLGISTIYASPIFKARSGSNHGYDVVDPRVLNPELGSPEAFSGLIEKLHECEMSWLQDIVPNHMAYDSNNPFLVDVLEYGTNSEYYHFFDIQWEHPDRDINGKILAPFLGSFYGQCLENGELKLEYSEAGLSINYYQLRFPLRIESYTELLTHNLGELRRLLGREHPDFIKLLGVLYLLKGAITETEKRQYKDQAAFVKGLIWELYQSNPEIRTFIDRNVETFNGTVGNPDSFDSLDRILGNQYFRLAFWKVGAEELNYRRFFTINELICVSIEEETVFDLTHSYINKLVENGSFQGVRVDHIDGLYDPKQYLDRLSEQLGDTYIVVEKILEGNETLPEDWAIQGTSGYDFLYTVNNLFCQTANEAAFTRIYQRFSGQWRSYHELEVHCKRLIAETNLAGDIENLANFLKQLASQYRYASDFTLGGLRRAIQELLVVFPIYRTYITPTGLNRRDRSHIERAVQAAKRQKPQLANELSFIEKLWLLDYDEDMSEAEKAQWTHFVMRMQQFSGPLMAKGVEDTLFYIYNRLISLNEVGGSPGRFGITLSEFHGFNQQQATYWTESMNASSTHDTKRSEDMRARLNVLSELPEEWEAAVTSWKQINQNRRQDDSESPDTNDEYFLYQTLVGVFPFDPYDLGDVRDRVEQYVVKAVREAKVHTAWLRPDTDYEEAFVEFVRQVLADGDDNEFLAAFRPFQQKIAGYGMLNSLSQTLLKLTAPGVPDLYQGTELWDFSLVDPDNRRPVDYGRQAQLLNDLQNWAAADLPGLLADLKYNASDGRIKLFSIHRLLSTRHQYRELFDRGEYRPLRVTGKHADRVVAFLRKSGEAQAIAIAPRFCTELVEPGEFPLGNDVWGNTAVEIPGSAAQTWVEAISGRSLSRHTTLSVGQLLADFPIALWVSD